jgi:hypothetical protein
MPEGELGIRPRDRRMGGRLMRKRTKRKRFNCKCGALFDSAVRYRRHVTVCVFAQLPPGLAGPTT